MISKNDKICSQFSFFPSRTPGIVIESFSSCYKFSMLSKTLLQVLDYDFVSDETYFVIKFWWIWRENWLRWRLERESWATN